MLPDYLSTSYQRYKSDTNYIAEWLATTAKQCGFGAYQPRPEPQPEKPKKLKGRARTLARRTAQASGQGANPRQEGNTTPQTTYIIAIKDFVPMARHIVSFAKSSIQFPTKFFTVLDRAISLRQRVSLAMIDDHEFNDFPVFCRPGIRFETHLLRGCASRCPANYTPSIPRTKTQRRKTIHCRSVGCRLWN